MPELTFKIAIWDKFSEQHKHQSNKTAPGSMPNQSFLGANKVHISSTF